MVLKKDYLTAVHSVKYGRGKKYSIVIGKNPFGPRGGSSGGAVDAAHNIDFHCSAAQAYNMKIIIDNILVFVKKCNIQTIDFDYDKCRDSLKRKNVNQEIIEKIIFNELIRNRENRFLILIYKNKSKYGNALKN
jgi:hypothetical protein